MDSDFCQIPYSVNWQKITAKRIQWFIFSVIFDRQIIHQIHIVQFKIKANFLPESKVAMFRANMT